MNDFSGKEPDGPSTHLEDTPPTPPVVRSVLEFGANNKGESDSTVAINQAIDAVFASGGGTVKFPDGEYKVGSTESVILKSRVSLSGDSGKSIIRLVDHSGLPGSGAALVGTGANCFDICNLVLDGNRENQDNLVSMIQLWNCSEVEIVRNVMVDCANICIALNDSHRALCSQNIFVDSQGTNIKVGNNSSNIMISENQFHDTGNYGKHDDGFIKTYEGVPGPTNVVVSGNSMIAPLGSGLDVAVWLRAGQHILVEKNRIQVSCVGIRVQADNSMRQLVFSDNAIGCRGAGVAVSYRTKPEDCVEVNPKIQISELHVTQNTIHGQDASGISIHPFRGDTVVKEVEIRSNSITIISSSKYNNGILAESSDTIIADNLIHLSGPIAGDGIQVAFDRACIERNHLHVSGAGSRGIVCFGSQCLIMGNFVSGPHGWGIDSGAGTSCVDVTENRLSDCALDIRNKGSNSVNTDNFLFSKVKE